MKLPSLLTSPVPIDYVIFTENAKNFMATTGRWRSLWSSNRLGKEGVVIDFGILKQKLEKVLKPLDHTYLNDLPYFSGIEPSSENIAKYIFDRLKRN